MGKGKGLGELEALTLAAILRVGEDANGRAVYDEIKTRTGRDPTLSGVHVTLRRLETKEWARSRLGTVSKKGGRPRRYYTVTPAGADALRAFRHAWDRVWEGLVLPVEADQ